MLSSLKKWVQDVTVDLTPPPSSQRSSQSSINHNFYTKRPSNERSESRASTSSVVYLSQPISMDSVGSFKTSTFSIPPPPASPAELDLSHLNREEQEHIASVLRRARAVDEQPSSLIPITLPSVMSPATSISSPSISSSTSTSSFVSEKIEKYNHEIEEEARKSLTPPDSTSTTMYQCQPYDHEDEEIVSISFPSQEKQVLERESGNTPTFFSQQAIPIKKSLSPVSILSTDHQEEQIYDNIKRMPDDDLPRNHNERDDQSIISPPFRMNHLTEIDENEFFYEQSNPYIASIISDDEEEQVSIPSYQIDELIDEDDHADERDHVKELEETIANLSRHFPLEQQLSIIPRNKIESDLILEMEIISPSTDELPFPPPSFTIPNDNHRGSLSRSSGVREKLTEFLVPSTSKAHPSLQRALSTHSKRVLSIHRHKRNLPSVPDSTSSMGLQLRRANSESRFSLPAVPSPLSPLVVHQNLDDESDLLEIDLNNPIGSTKRTSRSKTDSELKTTNENHLPVNTSMDNFSSKVKQLRDQTTNTPPISNCNFSTKSKKKLKKKPSSPLDHTTSPSITKLQKSTSTEITYPFPITKLILNPSRHGMSTSLGFSITGGHSIENCMDVTACIVHIDIHHRNYQILKNIVQEGDEVLELGGVSLRGKSALFVENLMNKIQNEFEITVRSQSVPLASPTSLTTDTNISRRHSMEPPPTPVIKNTVIKSRSTSIYSLHQTSPATANEQAQQEQNPSPKNLAANEESSHLFAHRHRPSLLPNDPGLTVTGSNHSIDRQNSNESDESDSLSQYFDSSQSRTSSVMTAGDLGMVHKRSQSVIPIANSSVNSSARLQNFLKSDRKPTKRGSTSIERKSSLAFASLNFLKKKTKSVDFSQQKNFIVNQLLENDYVGDIELQIGHDGEREQLVVRIIRAKNLIPKDTNGFSDPFVKVYLLPGRDQENKRRIKHVSKTLNPVWEHTVIYGHMHREELQNKKLEFTVWDYDRFKANDFIGQVTIDLKNPNVIDDKAHWYRLQALRSREEATNRGSSPRLYKMHSVDSSASSTLTINKHSVNTQARVTQQK